jgi:hypothetical protein
MNLLFKIYFLNWVKENVCSIVFILYKTVIELCYFFNNPKPKPIEFTFEDFFSKRSKY